VTRRQGNLVMIAVKKREVCHQRSFQKLGKQKSSIDSAPCTHVCSNHATELSWGTMKRTLLIAAAATGLLAIAAGTADHALTSDESPRFNSDGKLLKPEKYREWIFLTSGLGMSYGPLASSSHSSDPPFDNVFTPRAAYEGFLRNGVWPDKTMFVLEVRKSASKGSINKAGHYQADVMGVEVEVKDEKRFSNKWGFFDFDSDKPASRLPETEACYACHRDNGAVDNTFVQFYPTLLPVAKAKGTLRNGGSHGSR
jgi:Cytochrome P460